MRLEVSANREEAQSMTEAKEEILEAFFSCSSKNISIILYHEESYKKKSDL